MTLVQYIAFALVLVGTTLLYKLYYHSSLLQGERQACFAARYAAQQIHSLRVSWNMLPSNNIESALRCLSKDELEDSLPNKSFLYTQKHSCAKMDDAVHSTGPIKHVMIPRMDLFSFLLIFFSLFYHWPEHSRIFYGSPHFSSVMYILAQTSMM